MMRSKSVFVGLTVFLALSTGMLLAGEVVSVDTVVKPASAQRRSLSAPSPPSFAAGLWDSEPHVSLVPVDMAALRAEDTASWGVDKRLRFGVVCDLSQTVRLASKSVNAGQWDVLPNGDSVWRLILSAPDAVGLRVLLQDISLPAGCEFYLYSTDDPSQSCGPYDQASLAGQTSFWTGSVFADCVTLEVVCPKDVDKLSLKVEEVIYIYRNPYNMNKEGSCHNDVTCFTDWATEAKAVAGIGIVSSRNYVFCTGCLMNDNDSSSYIDYFMTANHCIENQADADTAEFYWFYKTTVCNGTPPSLANLPRTGGGADFLAGQDDWKNDFTFLKLRQESPAGVAYVGWTTQDPTSTETLTSIHLPDGSYERISFGRLDATEEYFWDIHWFSGVTEPGSSGSPLFNENHRFIGQLNGGLSYCWRPDGIDYYGRFDISYPLIKGWLYGAAGNKGRYLPGDYNGDGLDDLCVYYSDVGFWNIAYNSSDSSKAFVDQEHFNWGSSDMIPVPADYNGDGKTDVAVYYPDGGWWLIKDLPELSISWGWSEASPIPADYDGDGKADRAVYYADQGYWLIYGSTYGTMIKLLGYDDTIPVPGDYDGNGRDDLAIFVSESSVWLAFDFVGNAYVNGYSPSDAAQWGWDGVTPVASDYDGDGKTDKAVYSNGKWYIKASLAGTLPTILFGGDDYLPVPGKYQTGVSRSQLGTYLPATGLWELKDIGNSWTDSKTFGWSEALPPGL